ncbi:hypothetical protein AK812_SmicGene35184 [Symbiodinium microadriaticum]|uniref:Transposase n=1 Tax=Symbiodinium microadriaticum TaxID=2951 RepID=A0A1Q9CM41_SYMMI|nr:hypothetical protein AK812_SmicGene35184 [Symbiodinium microadriaticum]
MILPTMLSFGLIILGKPGIGKTPAAIVMVMAVARFLIQSRNMDGLFPGWRRSKQIDGFRERPGEVHIPVILDDPLLPSINVEDIKSFLDVGENGLVDARYRAAKFVRNQCRVLLNNEWCPDKEPEYVGLSTITWKQFLAMFQPALNDAPMPHVMATLKRASVIIAGDNAIYVRLASEHQSQKIHCINSSGITEDWLQETNKAHYNHYKNGQHTKYVDFDQYVEEETNLVSELLASPEEKEYLRRGATYDRWNEGFPTASNPATPRRASAAAASSHADRHHEEAVSASPPITAPPAKQPRIDLNDSDAEPLSPDYEVFETHLKKCSCGGNLSPSHEIEATLYDMLGQVKIKVRTWRCTSYGCRLTFGPNFAIHDSDKVNTAQPAEVKKARALFVSNKIAFSSVFLEYHARMEFRACVSSRAVQDVYRHTFGLKTNKLSGQWRKTYATAIVYYTALTELYPIGRHLDIVIGKELSPLTLKIYEQHVLHHVLPPHSRKAVTEVVADGHAKAHMKCANSHRHAGNPGKRGKDVTKPFGHGWFMVVNPADQRILWAKHMSQPEGNAILEAALMDVIPKFPNLDGVIVDRACSFLPHARHFKVMNQVKYWAVDAFHAQGSNAPTAVQPNRSTDYLASFVKRGKKSSTPYSCSKKPASKVLKRPSSKH